MDANEQLKNLAKAAKEYKEAAEVEIKSLKATIARLGRITETCKYRDEDRVKKYKAMDRMLRAEIIATVKATMTEVLEGADEVWLLPEELCKNFGMISQEWLNRYGKLLPREKAAVVMPDGTVKETRSWAYPKHRINRMIMEGKLKELRFNP